MAWIGNAVRIALGTALAAWHHIQTCLRNWQEPSRHSQLMARLDIELAVDFYQEACFRAAAIALLQTTWTFDFAFVLNEVGRIDLVHDSAGEAAEEQSSIFALGELTGRENPDQRADHSSHRAAGQNRLQPIAVMKEISRQWWLVVPVVLDLACAPHLS